MNRLWSTGIALALFCCGGQAFADKTCNITKSITINSNGTISLGSTDPCTGSGLSVTFKNTSGDSCIYSDAAVLPTPTTPAITITSSSVTAYCQRTSCPYPVPPYATDAGTVRIGSTMGTHKLIAAAASERASGSIRFKMDTTTPLTFKLYEQGNTTKAAPVPVDLSVSSCPGDFAAGNNGKCKVSGTYQDGVTIGGTNGCPVTANTDYYLNVRTVTPGRDAVFDLKAQQANQPP